MPIDPARLLTHVFPEVRHSYTRRDTILYALGIGMGQDPLDSFDLDYLLPTREAVPVGFANTLASPGMWIRDPTFGVDFARLIHSEQHCVFHNPLPSAATVIARPRVTALHDRGPNKGAVLTVERQIEDSAVGISYATITQTLLLRGDGGFGGEAPPVIQRPSVSRPADATIALPISKRAALIYQLSGDWNPLHTDPAAASRAGFSRPILQGLASFGAALHGIERFTGHRPQAAGCRFTGLVTPGDELSLSIHNESSGRILSRATCNSRNVLEGTFVHL